LLVHKQVINNLECEGLITVKQVLQSNLRRARRSSVDKTNSKLLGSHSPSMLMPLAVHRDAGRQQNGDG